MRVCAKRDELPKSLNQNYRGRVYNGRLLRLSCYFLLSSDARYVEFRSQLSLSEPGAHKNYSPSGQHNMLYIYLLNFYIAFLSCMRLIARAPFVAAGSTV